MICYIISWLGFATAATMPAVTMHSFEISEKSWIKWNQWDEIKIGQLMCTEPDLVIHIEPFGPPSVPKCLNQGFVKRLFYSPKTLQIVSSFKGDCWRYSCYLEKVSFFRALQSSIVLFKYTQPLQSKKLLNKSQDWHKFLLDINIKGEKRSTSHSNRCPLNVRRKVNNNKKRKENGASISQQNNWQQEVHKMSRKCDFF